MNDKTAASAVPPGNTRSWKPDPTPEEQAQLGKFLQQAFSSPFLQEVTARSMALMELAAGDKVLEVGCGTGVFLPLLAEAVGPQGQVIGVDYSAAMVADAQARIAAHNRGATTTAQVADACSLPFAAATFDCAHCERVLMHIEDPTAALREIARVVRPGGRIVVAEPDWTGIRIDHPDRADFDRLYFRSLAMRHPDMGLTIARRMAEAGCVEVLPQPVMAVFTDIGVVRSFGLNLSRGADALVEEGAMQRARADELLAKLEELHSAGRYFAAGLYHIVSCRVPT